MVLPYYLQTRIFAVRACRGFKGYFVHTRDFGKGFRGVVHDFERALYGGRGLQRMHRSERGIPCKHLVKFRVILHRAAAQRIKHVVDAFRL